MNFKLPFSKKNETPLQLPIPQEVKDNHVTQSIFSYLDMQTNGALLLTGDWGSGKTYFIKNFVFPLISEKKDCPVPIMVSLYGVVDKPAVVGVLSTLTNTTP